MPMQLKATSGLQMHPARVFLGKRASCRSPHKQQVRIERQNKKTRTERHEVQIEEANGERDRQKRKRQRRSKEKHRQKRQTGRDRMREKRDSGAENQLEARSRKTIRGNRRDIKSAKQMEGAGDRDTDKEADIETGKQAEEH